MVLNSQHTPQSKQNEQDAEDVCNFRALSAQPMVSQGFEDLANTRCVKILHNATNTSTPEGFEDLTIARCANILHNATSTPPGPRGEVFEHLEHERYVKISHNAINTPPG